MFYSHEWANEQSKRTLVSFFDLKRSSEHFFFAVALKSKKVEKQKLGGNRLEVYACVVWQRIYTLNNAFCMITTMVSFAEQTNKRSIPTQFACACVAQLCSEALICFSAEFKKGADQRVDYLRCKTCGFNCTSCIRCTRCCVRICT